MNATATLLDSSTSAAPLRKPQLPALTGVRTLLAVNIMLFHFTPPHLQLLYPMINNSYVFVGFFILLSGFVLGYNYADRPNLPKRDFWIARFARLYPIYLLSLVLFFNMLLVEYHVRSIGQFFTGLILTPLLLQAWHPLLATFWNTVAWTLSCEAAFYFLFPWLVKLRWPKTPGKLALLLMAIWAVGLTPHMLYMALNPDHIPGPIDRYSYGFWLRALKYTPLPYLGTFMAGVALAKLQSALPLSSRQRSAVAGLSLFAIGLFFAVAVQRAPYVLMHGGLLVPLFSALVIGLSGRNIFASIFSVRPLMLLGQASYALFLLHFNFINLLRQYNVPERLHVAAFDPWISYVATLLLAIAAMYLVERPARKFILQYKREPQPAGKAM